MSKIELIPLGSCDIDSIKVFTDKWIGENYFSNNEIAEIIERGCLGSENAGLKALCDGKLAGVRLTYAPGKWIDESARGLTPDKWNVDSTKVAYFKSLFVSGEFQQKGIGKSLSDKSIEILNKMGAEAILCHSWLESPGNSSQKYLMKMGFNEVGHHQKFWYPIDYECTRCTPNRCVCTAAEMIKYLKEKV